MNEKPPDPAEVRIKAINHAWRHEQAMKHLRDAPLASDRETEILEELVRDMLSTADVLEDYLSYFRV